LYTPVAGLPLGYSPTSFSESLNTESSR